MSILNNVKKILGLGIIGTSVLFVQLSAKEKEAIKVFANEKELVSDAWGTIQKYLKENQKGSPYLISCKYTISGKSNSVIGFSPIDSTVKVFYYEYHKQPLSVENHFEGTESATTDRVVEVVYKTTEEHSVSLTEKDPSAGFFGRTLRTKNITV